MSATFESIELSIFTFTNDFDLAKGRRIGRSQKGNHPKQDAGTKGDGSKKQDPRHGRGNGERRNGRNDRTRHAPKH